MLENAKYVFIHFNLKKEKKNEKCMYFAILLLRIGDPELPKPLNEITVRRKNTYFSGKIKKCIISIIQQKAKSVFREVMTFVKFKMLIKCLTVHQFLS